MPTIEIPEPTLSRLLFSNTNMAWLWLVIRLYVGYQWLIAGLEKVISPAWTGSSAGSAVKGFLMGSIAKSTGDHPAVSGWYADFIQAVALPHAQVFSYLVAYGELAVGIALIIGLFTGIAAFFGTFMNLNYLLAGTVSTNPVLLLLQLFIILAWRIAGWHGLDRWALPALGVPWQKGTLFKNK